MILSQFQSVGQDLFLRGLVSSHSGNMSIRLGDRLVITRRGSMLGRLTEQDLVETGIDRNDRATPAASSELAVHRAVYQETGAQAVIHAHPPYGIAFSLVEQEIVPANTEGNLLLGSIPVIGMDHAEQRNELAEEIARALKKHKIVLVRGHGSFAAGQIMEEAHQWTSALEESCQVLWLLRSLVSRPRSGLISGVIP